MTAVRAQLDRQLVESEHVVLKADKQHLDSIQVDPHSELTDLESLQLLVESVTGLEQLAMSAAGSKTPSLTWLSKHHNET